MTALLPWVLVAAAFVALALAFVRLLRGPCQADRVIALDVAFASAISLAAAVSLLSERALFLDIAVGLAAVGFVATLVWARLIDAATDGTATGASEGDS
jgi:multicomponent Na+:H+ antiporter subunit F